MAFVRIIAEFRDLAAVARMASALIDATPAIAVLVELPGQTKEEWKGTNRDHAEAFSSAPVLLIVRVPEWRVEQVISVANRNRATDICTCPTADDEEPAQLPGRHQTFQDEAAWTNGRGLP